MKVLVTGAAGFIGSTLTQHLLNEGCEVVGIDSITNYYSPALKIANVEEIASPRFKLIKADLANVDLDLYLADVEVVFHQAGQPGVRKSWGSEFSEYSHANVEATQILLEAARRSPKLVRFVYASSSSVYGNAETYPTRETDVPHPISPYGVTKLAGEHLCTLYADVFGVPTVSLRYFTVYGPRQRPDMAFNRFIRAALENDRITIYGDGTQIREFTYVDDIVRANLSAATLDVPPGTVANLSGGSSVSVNAVLGELEKILKRPVNVEYGKRADGDVLRTGGSTDVARAALGWAPTVPLTHGLESEVEWIRERMRVSR